MAAVIISTIAVIGAVGAVIVKFDKEGPEMINVQNAKQKAGTGIVTTVISQ